MTNLHTWFVFIVMFNLQFLHRFCANRILFRLSIINPCIVHYISGGKKDKETHTLNRLPNATNNIVFGRLEVVNYDFDAWSDSNQLANI